MSSDRHIWRRARDFHLYDEGDQRFLDCWREEGRALLGHSRPGVKNLLKQEINRGLLFSGASRWLGALEVSLRRLFPSLGFWRFLSGKGGDGDSSLPVTIWRPFEGTPPPSQGLVEPRLPVPGFIRSRLVVGLSEEAAGNVEGAGREGSLEVSSLEAALFCRGAVDLAAALKAPRPSWDRFDLSSLWERRGPWLFFRGPHERYDEVRLLYREARILIAPSPLQPTLLPFQWSSKEKQAMEKAARHSERILRGEKL